MIKFKCNKKDLGLVVLASKRAKNYYDQNGPKRSLMEIEMDITACHCNGCELDLEKLLTFDDFNFMHDVGGIANHINRTTGKLEDCFLPRSVR